MKDESEREKLMSRQTKKEASKHKKPVRAEAARARRLAGAETARQRKLAREEAHRRRKQQRAENAQARRERRENAPKKRKLLRGLFRLVLAGALVSLIAFLVVVIRGGSWILDLEYDGERVGAGLPEEPADCILILGAGLRGEKPSAILRERLDLGAALYRAGAAPKILVTGDNGRTDYNEVQVMENYLAEEQGIPREDIVRDHAGFCTYDSMVRAREVFCAERVLIVTQRYHLFRACYVANAVGLEAVGADCSRTAYSGREARELRECLARVKDFFWCIFRPSPRFLGEKIPIKEG